VISQILILEMAHFGFTSHNTGDTAASIGATLPRSFFGRLNPGAIPSAGSARRARGPRRL